MKQYLFLCLLLLLMQQSIAQPTSQQRFEDSVMGWKKIYSFKGKQYKPLTVEGQVFTIYQQSLRDSFITWMQRTYAPIGGWGDIYSKDYTTRQNKGPKPQGIGMDALVYGLYKSERTGKYEMITNEDHNDVAIYTNALAGINPVELFNSATGFFFTMLKKNYGSTFSDPELIKQVKEYGLHDDPRFSKYMVYFTGNQVTVVLTPGNQLPIVQLTKGEVLEQCERGILRELENRKAEARHMSSNDPSYYASVIKDLDEKLYPQCVKNLNGLKEKYKNKLNEPAVLYGWAGPSFSEFTSTSSLPTLFIEDWYQSLPGYPAYRFTKEALEGSKKNKPLWVAITWRPEKPNTRVKPYELHRAMLRYFNYDYVFNYFFNPDKVKGTTYSPSNAAEQLARISQLKKHWVKEEKPLPQGTHFMDDFSTNTEGDRPAGWNDSRSRTPAKVVSINNRPGKWVQLGHMNELRAANLQKKPLPENFSLDFDMQTDEFAVRTGGAVRLQLSSYSTNAEGMVSRNQGGTIVQVELTAGNEADYNNNNYRGEAVLSSNTASVPANEKSNGRFYSTYSLRELTNIKTGIQVTLRVKGGALQLFINNKPVATSGNFQKDYCSDCRFTGLPAGTRFRDLSFTNTTQNWSPDGKSNEVHVYISNVKITSE